MNPSAAITGSRSISCAVPMYQYETSHIRVVRSLIALHLRCMVGTRLTIC